MWRPPITCFEDDFEACIAHLRLPIKHRRLTRTTNLLEWLFVEERNRLQSGELFHGSVAARKVISRGPVESYDQVRNVLLTEQLRSGISRTMVVIRCGDFNIAPSAPISICAALILLMHSGDWTTF